MTRRAKVAVRDDVVCIRDGEGAHVHHPDSCGHRWGENHWCALRTEVCDGRHFCTCTAKTTGEDMASEFSGLREMPIGNLIVLLQKLAKKASYVSPAYRSAILLEAAHRLNTVNNTIRELRKD